MLTGQQNRTGDCSCGSMDEEDLGPGNLDRQGSGRRVTMERARERQSAHQRIQRRQHAGVRMSREAIEMSAVEMSTASVDGVASGQERACYLIEGGIPLKGEVRNSGAKNAATKLMVAALL